MYGCSIKKNSNRPFVEIQKNVKIGNNCKISSHTFICSGVSIGDNCFIGHGVVFIMTDILKLQTKTVNWLQKMIGNLRRLFLEIM